MKSICRALFSPLEYKTQCLDVNIHFAIRSGGYPLPTKNSISLKESLSAVGFFPEKLLNVSGPGSDSIEDISVK